MRTRTELKTRKKIHKNITRGHDISVEISWLAAQALHGGKLSPRHGVLTLIPCLERKRRRDF